MCCAQCCCKVQVLLENQLEMENMKVETGKKKIALLHDQLHEKVNFSVASLVCDRIVFTRSSVYAQFISVCRQSP